VMGEGVPCRVPSLSAIAHGLSLAAAPVFSGMALLTATWDSDVGMLCSVTSSGTAVNGMVVMYLLMALFHASPWLSLIRNQRNGTLS
jgi:hypothetical protein